MDKLKDLGLWLLNTLLISPLIILFIWNVLVVLMFGVGRITFSICVFISVFLNILWSGIRSNID